MALFDLIGRRWILRIIWELHQARQPLTFRELRTACEGISSSVLTHRLRELADAQIAAHTGDGYALTNTGESLVASLQPILDWSRTWDQQLTDLDPPGRAADQASARDAARIKSVHHIEPVRGR